MFRLLFALCLLPFSALAFATPTIQSLLNDGNYIAPIKVMKSFESQYRQRTICGFNVEVDNQSLVYTLSMVDLATDTRTYFHIRAADGKILGQNLETIVADKEEQVHAVKVLQKKRMTFSKVVKMARKNHAGFLVQADLDHDLSISYVELKLLNQDSKKSTAAFDIENLRPLPLLKWN
ncbi:hypothetical protein ACFOD0_10320 [Shewanella intestini]|uniref:Uncharacterized protein n=1 Tax=Shewanella intestini TaxID=2017544 RepID=A0ABS5I6I5_9GAMM|nr:MULTISPECIES: hypothetical protein [Shewanella]MBR9729329.1 hypothetical protein [Shewanella intestini]MRG37408.1 hypothetical protein [Shewanella sp. XMDDZSB0408]